MREIEKALVDVVFSSYDLSLYQSFMFSADAKEPHKTE
jgi:hypothetical protein